MRERYQRPKIMDLGSKWKIVYWDYSSNPRKKRSKVWAKSNVYSRREAQRLADEFMERVNARNNEPSAFPNDNETLTGLLAKCRQMTWPFLKNSTRKHVKTLASTQDQTALRLEDRPIKVLETASRQTPARSSEDPRRQPFPARPQPRSRSLADHSPERYCPFYL